MKLIRKRIKLVALSLMGIFLFEISFPTAAWALTSGPSTPEVQEFTPVGVSDMVDLFTGDFSYNIPLMEVDGYPVNISYAAGINVEQEASWVGLGWNLNPGTIDRTMKGVPDEFNGNDKYVKHTDMKTNWTLGLAASKSFELFGYNKSKAEATKNGKPDSYQYDSSKWTWGIGATAKYGITINSYNGTGLDVGFNTNFTGKNIVKTITPALSGGLDLNYNGSSGLTVSGNVNLGLLYQDQERKINSAGLNTYLASAYNSRAGMKNLSFGWQSSLSYTKRHSKVDKAKTAAGSSAQDATSYRWQNRSAGLGFSGSLIDYGGQSWTPFIETPMKNTAINLSVAFGKEVVGLTKNWSFPCYYTQQTIANNQPYEVPAYGYMHLDQAGESDMLDLNREKDQPISQNLVDLPIPINTPDVWSVSAQGIGGSFRVYRNDHINYYQQAQSSESNDYTAGFDIGTLKNFKGGLNLSWVRTNTESGIWENHNALKDSFHLVSRNSLKDIHPEYEPYYFRQMGEATVSNVHFNKGVNGYSLMLPKITGQSLYPYYTVFHSKNDPTGTKSFKQNTGGAYSNGINNIQVNRQPRNMVMYGVKAGDSYYIPSTKYLRWFYPNAISTDGNGQLQGKRIASRNDAVVRKSNHYTEFNVIGPDGSRYVYGMPVYNFEQTDVTFALGKDVIEAGDCGTGLAAYEPGIDDVPGENSKGNDHFVQKITTPAYPYAYQLTGIVSPDYVDLTGDGISDDDLGTATKFNYQKAQNHYQWRIPIEEDRANYSEGKKYDFNDDRGSIIYGKKELSYLHSIEGKNHVAVFYISARKDGLGVAGMQGGAATAFQQYKLDSIILYNKQDLIQNGTDAYKIKGVHFTYTYELCGGVPNFNGTQDANGKLTLAELYFTYGNSFKGKLSPYKFKYNNQESGERISYHSKASDRWGSYTPPGNYDCDNVNYLNSTEFPFTHQDESVVHDYAATWSLKEIILPSGGKISVEYEADDYAYVQDKRAMSMYKVLGFGHTNIYADLSDHLYWIKDKKINNYIFLELPKATTSDQFKQIVKGVKDLQFTAFVDINGQGNYEYVKSYATFNWENEINYGLVNSTTAWVKVETVHIRDGDKGQQVNPYSLAVWNWAKINASDLVYNTGYGDYDGAKVFRVFYQAVGLYNEFVNIFLGINNNLRRRGFGQIVNTDKSWLRLNAHGFKKYGGGLRVKSIKINDNWSVHGSMNSSAADAEYGQQYDYTTTQQVDGNSITISSGVAAWEPAIGGDENPHHLPEYVIEEQKFVPDLKYMSDVPSGESFMPGPTVGYSKVTVSSLDYTGVSKTATGFQEHHFYTAKDYPSKVSTPGIRHSVLKPSFADQFFNFSRKQEKKLSSGQGYLVELNDMHGKKEAEYSYNQNGEQVGGMEVEYINNPGSLNELSNTVQVVSKDGTISDKELATEVEIYNDFRRAKTEVVSTGVDLNLDFFTLSILPFLIPSLYDGFSVNNSEVQSAVTVKVVKRYGLIKKTVAIKEGSRIETENLLYDDKTGEVLVSSVQNEFDDNIYSKKTPAHWAYDEGMGPAYKNIGLVLEGVKLWQDSIILPNGLHVRDFLVPGDEVMVTGAVATICHVYEGKGQRLNLITQSGVPYYYPNPNKEFTLQVIRSGRRNMHTLPIMQESAHYYSTAGNSLILDSLISTSAVEFDDYWPYYNDKIMALQCDTTYTIGLEAVKSYFNSLISNTDKSQLASNKIKLDEGGNTNCLEEILNQYPEITYLDSIYYKDDNGNYQAIKLGSESFFGINDSVFVELEASLFKGYPAKDFEECITLLYKIPTSFNASNQVGAHELDTQFKSLIQEQMSYDGLNCPDTTLGTNAYFKNNMSLAKQPGEADFKLNFTWCDGMGQCDLEFFLAEEVFIDSFVQMLDVHMIDLQTYESSIIYHDEDGNADTVDVTIKNSCSNALAELDCYMVCSAADTSELLNPYRYGIKGNWRVKRNWAYVGERNYSNQTRSRTDGTFKTYDPYYYDDGQEGMNKSSSNKWVWATQVSKYNPFGAEIENEDALGRFSAAVYGFNFTLPTSVAGNSKFNQIASESFEENAQFWNNEYCYDTHFGLDIFSGSQGEYNDDYSHSGNYSLKVNSNQQIGATVEITSQEDVDILDTFQVKWKNANGIGRFNPDTGTYVMSVWVKQGESYTDTTYADAKVTIKQTTGAGTTSTDYYADGPIIDGWQRIFVTFHIDTDVEELEFVFDAPESEAAWFDDFRVHPFNSSMKTYAYDQVTLRLMAELDDNNFATYYEYDKEGALIRVKKETVKGVRTLKEVRKKIYKNP